MFFQSAKSLILCILFCSLHLLISAQSLLLAITLDYKISSPGDLVSVLEHHGPGWGHEPDWGDRKLSKRQA